MFAYELPLDPPCDEWKEYLRPQLCKRRIESICQDILRRGEKTFYRDIYDAIYELVLADVEAENLEKCYYLE